MWSKRKCLLVGFPKKRLGLISVRPRAQGMFKSSQGSGARLICSSSTLTDFPTAKEPQALSQLGGLSASDQVSCPNLNS